MKKAVKWVASLLLAIFVITNQPALAAHMKGKPKIQILLNWLKKTKKAADPEQKKFVVKFWVFSWKTDKLNSKNLNLQSYCTLGISKHRI